MKSSSPSTRLPSPARRFAHPLLWLAIGGVIVAGLTGCGRPPAVESNNLPLIVSLRTALSARNPEWLGGVERAVAERRKSQQMSETSAAHFDYLIQLARQGEWETSERACLDFERAQMNRRR